MRRRAIRRSRRPPTRRRREHNARRNANLRRSVVTNSLFGLGAPELVVILGLGAFVLGPDKLASMAKDFGKVAASSEDVPKEFKEGLEEGEAAKAARMLEEGDTKEGRPRRHALGRFKLAGLRPKFVLEPATGWQSPRGIASGHRRFTCGSAMGFPGTGYYCSSSGSGAQLPASAPGPSDSSAGSLTGDGSSLV